MVGLILPANIKYAPYIQNYISILEKNSVPYEIIWWNKRGIETPDENSYRKVMPEKTGFIGKFLYYIGFSKFVRKILKKKKYSKLIVFTLVGGIFLSDVLLKKYKNNYIFDVRDDSPLRKIFPNRIVSIAKNAELLVSSSPCYSEWLNREAILCHNTSISAICDGIDYIPSAKASEKIAITCAGTMLEGTANLNFLKKYANNQEITFKYYGPINENMRLLQDFANEQESKNVFFFGPYNKEDIYEIYRNQTDYVNILRHESVVNKEALPNKFYEAVIAGTPFIAYKHNEAISKYADKYNLGVIFENEDELFDDNNFMKKLQAFDYSNYVSTRKAFLSEALADLEKFEKEVTSFLIQ